MYIHIFTYIILKESVFFDDPEDGIIAHDMLQRGWSFLSCLPFVTVAILLPLSIFLRHAVSFCSLLCVNFV